MSKTSFVSLKCLSCLLRDVHVMEFDLNGSFNLLRRRTGRHQASGIEAIRELKQLIERTEEMVEEIYALPTGQLGLPRLDDDGMTWRQKVDRCMMVILNALSDDGDDEQYSEEDQAGQDNSDPPSLISALIFVMADMILLFVILALI